MSPRSVRCLVLAGTFCLVVVPAHAAETETDMARAVVAYFEGTPLEGSPARDFAAFELFGCQTLEQGLTAYGWVIRLGFELRQDQVFSGPGFSSPVVVQLERRAAGLWVTGHQRPPDGDRFEESVVAMFPKEYWGRALGRCSPGVVGALEDRIMDYYRAALPPGRFAWKPRPLELADPHNHSQDIYAGLNLRSVCDYIRLITLPLDQQRIVGPTEAAEATPGAKPPSVSPDGRFIAKVDPEEAGLLLIYDRTTGRALEVINNRHEVVDRPVWKRNGVLTFDQVNGKLGDREFGVHIEVDISSREVVWAVPYGPLGFAETDLRR